MGLHFQFCNFRLITQILWASVFISEDQHNSSCPRGTIRIKVMYVFKHKVKVFCLRGLLTNELLGEAQSTLGWQYTRGLMGQYRALHSSSLPGNCLTGMSYSLGLAYVLCPRAWPKAKWRACLPCPANLELSYSSHKGRYDPVLCQALR